MTEEKAKTKAFQVTALFSTQRQQILFECFWEQENEGQTVWKNIITMIMYSSVRMSDPSRSIIPAGALILCSKNMVSRIDDFMTYATAVRLLITMRYRLNDIQKRLSHSDIRMTAKVCVHLDIHLQ